MHSPVPTPVLIVLGDAELLGVVVRVGLEVALARSPLMSSVFMAYCSTA